MHRAYRARVGEAVSVTITEHAAWMFAWLAVALMTGWLINFVRL